MIFHLTTSKPSFIETDSIVFLDPDTTEIPSITSRFSESEKECFTKEKVLFNDLCEELLKTGTCPDGQWLILDYQSANLPQPQIRPKCARRPCPINFFYWPKDGKCYAKWNVSTLCPGGNMLVNDVFGDGTCQCINDPPYGAIDNGTCYLLYARGPCMNQRIFVEKENGTTDCIPDKCYTENQRLTGNKTMVYLEAEKRCYQLGERGPCPDGKLVRIDLGTKKPACALPTPVAILNLVNPQPTCGTSHGGQCVTEIKTPSTDTHFVASVLAQAHKKRNNRK